MVNPRWRKVLADLFGNKARTLLVALSIAIGVFSIGVVSGSYFILQRDVPSGFYAANPHSAVIYTQPFGDDLLVAARRTEGVRDVEGRSSFGAEVKILDGTKAGITISGIPALQEMRIDKVDLEQGSPELGYKEVYLERASIAALGVKPGDTLTILIDDKHTRSVKIAGIVHDVWASMFALSRTVSAYATPETIEWLGGSRQYDTLLLTVSEHGNDEAHVKQVTKLVSDKIERGGREVFFTVVFRPGIHPAQQTIDAVLALLGAMGILALFLSAFLVVNTINALLSQQVRYIGVMKSIGASIGQVAGMYIVLILAFGVIALLIAVPLAGVTAYLLSSGIAQLLNLDLNGFRVPSETIIIEVAIGLGVPLFASAGPVWNGARLTVREAMSNYGLATAGSRTFFDRILENFHALPRPLLLSLRNTFRKKWRLTLTLSTLVLGGAIFIAVMNVRSSLYSALNTTFGYILSDVNVDFRRTYRMKSIEATVLGVPGVISVEGWAGGVAQVIGADGITADDIQILAPPGGSSLIQPVLTSGRWLMKEDQNAVVVGNHYIKLHPETKVGDEILLRIEEKDYPFRIVGIYQMAGTVLYPILYMNFEELARVRNEAGQVYSIRVVTESHAPERQQEIAKILEERLKKEGFLVSGIVTASQTISQQRVTVDILIYLLFTMAILIAVVGGLGLMGTMGMNVMERTREIGVMRSIGAVDAVVMQLVIVEGIVIGLISWALGALLSVPIARGLNTIIGTTLLNVPLNYVFSFSGLAVWAVVILLVSTISCIIPARNAVRLTIRDVLAYE